MIARYILILTFSIHLDFVELSSKSDSHLILPPKKRWLSSWSEPSQPAVGELNAAKTGASGSRKGLAKFRVRDRPTPAVQGPVNAFIIYKGKRIEVLLDLTGTVALRADYPGNIYPSRHFYRHHNFLCRLSKIGGVRMVEYINQNGSLLGVRAPTPTSANIMEPDVTKWFIVYIGKYFKVKQNRYTAEAEAINLIPENVNEDGHKPVKVDIAGFEFFVFRGPDGNISGAALLPSCHN